MPFLLKEDQHDSLSRQILTVTELNQTVQQLFSDHFPLLWIEGEISNLTRAPSGHLYFSLKDSNSQVRCAMFAGKNRLLNFSPRNGQQIIIRARISLYQARGDYQLIVEDMEPCGEGALRLAYEQLKKKLHAAGLFDENRKQSIPKLPHRIGIITSPTGAALRDCLHVLERRYPLAEITIYPSLVQGEQAVTTLCKAIQQAQKHALCDVLLIVRGGGSLEDLWCFNDEMLAQTIFDCTIPIISGIGHEIDFTIADFVADLRAPTPSVAAEMATPDCIQLKQAFVRLQHHLSSIMQAQLLEQTQSLDQLWQRLLRQHPLRRIQTFKDQLHTHTRRLSATLQRFQQRKQEQLQYALTRIQHQPLEQQIVERKKHLYSLKKHLIHAIASQIQRPRHRLQLVAQSLNQISPLATLDRGYAIINNNQGHIITQSQQTKKGEHLTITLHQGQLQCTVTSTQKKKTHRKSHP